MTFRPHYTRAYGLGQVLSPGGNPLGGFGSTLGFLVDSFGPYGVWDYKEYVPNPAHQRYGNQNFGAVMHHLGVSRYGAQSIAGVVQTVTDAWSGNKYGRALNYVWPTYGDAPGDSADIAAGWDFAAAGFKCK